MTIVFFTSRFYPEVGGVEKHALEVSKELIKRGHNIIVVSENHGGLKDRENYGGIEIYRIKINTSERLKKFVIWKWLFENRKLIEKADIVHCLDVFYWFLPFRFFYPKKPVFTTFCGYETQFPPSKKAIFIRKISEKLSWGNICVGDFIKKWYGTKPDFVTYGGINEA